MMNKVSKSVFTLIVLLALSACSLEPQDDRPEKEEEQTIQQIPELAFSKEDRAADPLACNPRYNRRFSNTAASKDALYFITDDFSQSRLIRYIDRTTGDAAPLCGKPECQHLTKDCNAFVRTDQVYGLSYYDGKLYWLQNEYTETEGNVWRIYAVDPDGNNRKVVRTISNKSGSASEIPGGNTRVFFHYGYMYVCGELCIWEDPDSEIQRKIKLLAYSLTEPEKDLVIEDFSFVTDGSSGVMIDMQPFEKGICYNLFEFTYDEEDGGYTKWLDISEFKPESGQKIKLLDHWDGSAEKGFIPGGSFIDGSSVLFSSADGRIFCFDMQKTVLEVHKGFEEKNGSSPEISANITACFADHQIDFYHLDGSLFAEVSLSELPADSMYNVMSLDSGGMLLECTDPEGNVRVGMVSVRTGKFVEFWKSY